jgi:hypothetical protein
MTKQEKANLWLGKLARSYIMWIYRRQVCFHRRANPGFYPTCSPEIEARHKLLWSPLHKNVSCEWLRFFAHASGLEDFKYVPEDIFYGIIEPNFNDTNYSWVIADKNFYDLRFDSKLFPETILRNVAGDFLDADYNILTSARAKSLLESQRRDLVIKPSLDSGGGRNVAIIKYRDGCYFTKYNENITFDEILQKWRLNYVIQERISQHSFFSEFNPASVNTIRAFTYRSPLSENVAVLKAILRMGIGENDVDNENAGGISVGILANGMLNSYACSKYGNKHLQHPSTKKPFANQPVPCLERILATAQQLAQNIPAHRFLSFDLTLDQNEKVKVLEVNTSGQGLLFLQTFGGSLFAEHTQEIIEHCATHKKQSQFKHLRLIA